MSDARDLIDDTLELASLPAVVLRALELLNAPDSSAADIGQVISEDPALSVRLLRIVNSSFYGFPSRIETISRAITIVGTLEITDLVLGSSAVEAFAGLPNELIEMQQFWEHSLYAGVVARVLARHHRAPNTERFFVSGLLHDIGSLVLYNQRPEESRRALELARAGRPLHQVEQEIFGFDHSDVGAELMQAWNLPDAFIEAARHHHRPVEAQEFPLETAMVHLADVIAAGAHLTGSATNQVPPLEPRAWELTGLSLDITESVIEEADRQYADALAVILPSASAA
ncbi:MAG: HDOD domain-containing protein [Gammaproteobacteria bacterium]|nr:HDOD domain-containing protein [Gammaproteobacteria bacterium]MCW9057799.1 HDOD domain-containing protein [Gammaproteobacteria bacterium]